MTEILSRGVGVGCWCITLSRINPSSRASTQEGNFLEVMPLCLLAMTELGTDFISNPPPKTTDNRAVIKPAILPVCAHRPTSPKQMASSPCLLSTSHEPHRRQASTLPHPALLWRAEEGEFSVTACMHLLYITLCST